MTSICILGDVIVDVTLPAESSSIKMRLGGIVHAARALWAMDIAYSIAYFAPDYLDPQIKDYLSHFGSPQLIKLGSVDNCPYVMLIQEIKEVSDQGYEFLLRDNIKISYNEDEIHRLNQFDNIFIISGNYDYGTVTKNLPSGCKKHLDVSNNVPDILSLEKLSEVETIFISTSSPIFKNYYNEVDFSINTFFSLFKRMTKKIVLKENRGGSRAYDTTNGELIKIPSQTQEIVHSVGVGDVYDVVSIVLGEKVLFEDSLNISSWIATEYAKTTFPVDFKKMVSRVLKIDVADLKSLGGCQLPWELRKQCHIYIAAPDFDFVDTTQIDLLERSLLYHNFVPHRPIKENGQMETDASPERKNFLFNKDMVLLDHCNMLIAVLLYNDPGTLIEIGLAAERKIPTLVYDPQKIATNCVLTQLPMLISSDLDKILSEVFNMYSKLIN